MARLPEIKPVLVTIDVDHLPPMELRVYSRDEMQRIMGDGTAEAQTEATIAVLGGDDEAREWFGRLPHMVSIALVRALLDASSAAPSEVAQAGESSGGAPTSASDSTSRESSG